MKEFKLDSFLEPVSERVRTPFFASFVISWLIVNWKILYVTLFFEKEDFYGFDIINYLIHVHYINPCDNLVKPLICSLIYLFVFPYFDIIVFKFNEKRKRIKIEQKINIGKEFSVPGKRYWDLYNDMQDVMKQFDTIHSKNTELISSITQKEIDLNNSTLVNEANQVEIRNLKQTNAELLKTNDLVRNRNYAYEVFNGSWQVRLSKKSLYCFEDKEFYEINGNNELYKHTNNSKVGDIVFFELDILLNRLLMLIKVDIEDNKLFFITLYKEKNGLYSNMVNGTKMTIDKDRNSPL